MFIYPVKEQLSAYLFLRGRTREDWQGLCLCGAHFLVGKTDNKKVNNIHLGYTKCYEGNK